MSTGIKSQLLRQIGEHLVVVELGKRGILATPFAGNVPHFDLLAADDLGNSLSIQVKTIQGPSWQFNRTKFLDIEFEGDKQIVRGEKELALPELACVFIKISKNEEEYYIFKWKVIQDHFLETYKGGVRPKNPKSTHCAIWPKDLVKYKDNWGLILNHFK